jgi:ornithine cyclodeaminase/alanine dehydrogenase-like protein (mu-crystallin family)
MLVLNARDIEELLPIADCIEAAHTLFIDLARGGYFNPLRQRFSPPESSNWMTVMPALRLTGRRLWCLKQMVVTPTNSTRGIDPLQGAVLVHDGDDGRLLAVLQVASLTSIRTAAVTAVATRTLARPNPRIIAVLGTGVQGRAHIQAMRHLYPATEIRLWGRDRLRCEALAASVGAQPSPTAEAAMVGADIVCTVTGALQPFVRREWFGAGCHLNAVGSSTRAAREIDSATIAAASLFVDMREAALGESGDILGAMREGAMTPEHIRAELGEVLIGKHPGRTSEREFTLYKSLGFAALDLMAAELVIGRALAHGRGAEVDWQG